MSLWKKTEKPESSAEKPEGKETEKPGLPVDKAAARGKNRPQITGVSPRAAIPGGEIVIRGSGLAEDGRRPQVRFGDQPGSLLLSSSNRLIVRVPEDVVSRNLTVETGSRFERARLRRGGRDHRRKPASCGQSRFGSPGQHLHHL